MEANNGMSMVDATGGGLGTDPHPPLWSQEKSHKTVTKVYHRHKAKQSGRQSVGGGGGGGLT